MKKRIGHACMQHVKKGKYKNELHNKHLPIKLMCNLIVFPLFVCFLFKKALHTNSMSEV